MKIIKGSIFDHLDDKSVMLHVCNDAGGYGGGPTAIATQVRQKYPTAYTNYCHEHVLGSYSWDDDMKVFNLVAQKGYGRKGPRYLNYGALSVALVGFMDVNFELQDRGITRVLIPYGMGADRAGGDFEIIHEICEMIVGSTFELVVVKF